VGEGKGAEEKKSRQKMRISLLRGGHGRCCLGVRKKGKLRVGEYSKGKKGEKGGGK